MQQLRQLLSQEAVSNNNSYFPPPWVNKQIYDHDMIAFTTTTLSLFAQSNHNAHNETFIQKD